jgi:hypothetical protein
MSGVTTTWVIRRGWKNFTCLASKQISNVFTHCVAAEVVSLESRCHCTLANLADPPSHSLGKSGVALADHEQGLGVVQGQFHPSFICEALTNYSSPLRYTCLCFGNDRCTVVARAEGVFVSCL